MNLLRDKGWVLAVCIVSAGCSGASNGNEDAGDVTTDISSDRPTGDAMGNADRGDIGAVDVIENDVQQGVDVTPGMDVPDPSDVLVGIDIPPGADVANNLCPMPSRACYTGPAGTANVGACREGQQVCAGGMFAACVGDIVPSSEVCDGSDNNCDGMIDNVVPAMISCGVGACLRMAPACTGGRPSVCVPGPAVAEMCGNMLDDNCDGVVDEGCGCTYVSLTGNDANAGTLAMPKRTITAAIATVVGGGRGGNVCVLGTNNCGPMGATATYAERVVMANSVNVLGGFSPNNGNRVAGCTTRIAPAAGADAVNFPATVVSATSLDRFTVDGPMGGMTSVGVSVVGIGAIVNDNVITGGGAANLSTGVTVATTMPAARSPVLLTNNQINGGAAPAATGVSVSDSLITIRGNCSTFDAAGRCSSGCFGGATRFIRARPAGGSGASPAIGVSLNNVGAGSVIESSAICAGASTANNIGVMILGNATGVILRDSNVTAFGQGNPNIAVAVNQCIVAPGGAQPLISNNFRIASSGGAANSTTIGIRSAGPQCPTTITNNLTIIGGEEGASASVIGVQCDSGSACTITNNNLISGSNPNALNQFPPNASGVRCEGAGACSLIAGNGAPAPNVAQSGILGFRGANSFGLVLNDASPVVARNLIAAGCATVTSIGVDLTNSGSRLENNIISSHGAMCPAGVGPGVDSMAMRVSTQLVGREANVHSNTLTALGAAPCTARALVLAPRQGAMPPFGPIGIYRNNILGVSGLCTRNVPIHETNVASDPRIVENNDLFMGAAMMPTLYADENNMVLNSIVMVNGLMDITSANNMAANPMLNATQHLLNNSPCIDRGTAIGAPPVDIDNQARPRVVNMMPGFDIGADEFVP